MIACEMVLLNFLGRNSDEVYIQWSFDISFVKFVSHTFFLTFWLPPPEKWTKTVSSDIHVVHDFNESASVLFFISFGGGLIAKSCPTLATPWTVACHSSVHGSLQARILEWVAISFSRGSSGPRNQTWVSCIAGRFFTNWTTRKALISFEPYTLWTLPDVSNILKIFIYMITMFVFPLNN